MRPPVPRTAAALDRIDAGIVREAVREERKLRIAYLSEGDQETVRIIWPVAIAFFERVRVVVAWCELRRDFRSFRTDRVTSATFLGERYPERPASLRAKWRSTLGQRTSHNT